MSRIDKRDASTIFSTRLILFFILILFRARWSISRSRIRPFAFTNSTQKHLLCRKACTYRMNMFTPVGSIARLIPFQEATIVYFWRAVRGSRGSGAAGAGGSLSVPLSTSFLFSLPLLLASLPNSHPIFVYFLSFFHSQLDFFFSSFFLFTRIFFDFTNKQKNSPHFSHCLNFSVFHLLKMMMLFT